MQSDRPTDLTHQQPCLVGFLDYLTGLPVNAGPNMHACIITYMHAYIPACKLPCRIVGFRVRVKIPTHIRSYIHTYSRADRPTDIITRPRPRMHACMHYIHPCLHTHMQTPVPYRRFPRLPDRATRQCRSRGVRAARQCGHHMRAERHLHHVPHHPLAAAALVVRRREVARRSADGGGARRAEQGAGLTPNPLTP